MPSITQQHVLGPYGDPVRIAEALIYEPKFNIFFGKFSHVILKAEQKSAPCGAYNAKEIKWEVNVDQILVNEYSGHTVAPIGKFTYTGIMGKHESLGSGDTIVTGCNNFGETGTQGYSVGDALHRWRSDNGGNVPFSAYDLPGYYDFTHYLIEHQKDTYIFKTVDILASEEARIEHAEDERGIIWEPESDNRNLVVDDYRKKHIEMEGTLSVNAGEVNSQPYFYIDPVFTYVFKLIITIGDQEHIVKTDQSLLDIMGLYNKINIREMRIPQIIIDPNPK